MISHTRWPTAIAVGLVAAIVVACNDGGGGGGGNGGITPPSAGINVTLSTSSLSVMQGQSGSVTTTVTRMNGFSGDVNLVVENAPSGVTSNCSLAAASGTALTCTLEVSVAMTTTPGMYTLTVRGSGTGILDDTETLTLTIMAAGSYSLSVSPTNVIVQQGGAGSATATIARTDGFAGGVELTSTGAPTGMTVVASPTVLLGSAVTSTLAINVGPSVAAGSYTITVRGTSTGLAERTTTFNVQVTAGGGNTVTVGFCGSDVPIWFAVQNEGGSWSQLPGVGGTYSFTIGSRAAVAAVVPDGNSYLTTVIYASASEIAAMGQATIANCQHPETGSKHLTGSVANVGSTQSAWISIGDATASVEGGGLTYSLDDVPDGASDLVAVRLGLVDYSVLPDKVIIRRGLNLPGGSQVPVHDFAASEAFAPVIATATLSNVGGDSVIAANALLTATNTVGLLSGSIGTTQHSFGAIPASKLAAGDVHMFEALATPRGVSTEQRGVMTYFGSPADQALAFGPSLGVPTITTLSAGAPQRFRAQLASQSAYARNFGASFFQGGGLFGNWREVTIYVTADYLGAAPATWDASVPDLSQAGYSASWGLAENTTVDWEVMASSLAALPISGIVPTAGTTGVLAMRSNVSLDELGLSATRVMRRPLQVRRPMFVPGVPRR